MRVVKDPEERRNEIMDAAHMLFLTKGYNKTTIIDILTEVGIAKGTFYYYFKSKEEIMDAIIMRIVDADVARAKRIAGDAKLPVIKKFLQIITSQSIDEQENKEDMVEQMHHVGNAEMHQKGIVQSILKLTPVLTGVIEQGMEENIFEVEYPQETMEFLLVAGQIIFDQGFFQWEDEQLVKKADAFITIMEKALGAKKGSFAKMKDILLN